MSDKPLVTCVCPTTAGRREWMPNLLACFESQTYENRELLIVVEEGTEIEIAVSDRIRIAKCLRGITLGAKRNFACAHSGELVAHFDDDDWSAPERLTHQVERLEVSGLPITGYSQMKFTNGEKWWKYIGTLNWPLGTSLLYQRSWWLYNPFPIQQVGSDTALINHARGHKQIDVVECGDRMFARQHKSNTNKRNFYNSSTFMPLPATEAIAA